MYAFNLYSEMNSLYTSFKYKVNAVIILRVKIKITDKI